MSQSSNLPVVNFTPGQVSVVEGNTFTWNFSLDQPVPKGGLTLNLPVQNNTSAPEDVNYFLNGSTNITDFSLQIKDDVLLGFSVTLAEGVTEAKLVSEAVVDNIDEIDENFTTVLANGEGYKTNPQSNKVITTIENALVGTPGNDILTGNNTGDNIFGNGGMDSLIGGSGDDNIYGGSDADTINGGAGNDRIFGNGGADLINSGTGFDSIFLGVGKATVILETGLDFDTIYNFQLDATKFKVSSLGNLSFTDGADGVSIFQGDKLIAVVPGQSANTFSSNQDNIFTV
ncbi:MAG: hypothetical protein SAK29_24085 [Scytonema sp. PMC 1069.18]|nr:hypothetical protein [Scytonema sp. PMC 1069.18]MEC4885074.1 hypothetical protein [Scytonema sp. PMC 1070.18]